MPSLQLVQETHRQLCKEALDLVGKKGADYNRKQQLEGDTLFNLKVAALLGIVQSAEGSVLVRVTDKLMRLISLTSPKELQKPEVEDEKIRDTIVDMINYLVYIFVLYDEKVKQNLV